MRERLSTARRPDTRPEDSGFVGQRLGELFGLETAPAIVTDYRHKANVGITYLHSDNVTPTVTEPRPTEDAFLIALALKDVELQVWEDGRPSPRRAMAAGEATIGHLARSQAALIEGPHRFMCFYLPQAVFDEIADDLGRARVTDLRYRPGEPLHDPVISGLGSLLLPTLERPERTNPMFVEYVSFAFGAHVAQTYGGMQPWRSRHKGALAAWQERRAKELISAHLGGDASLQEIARQCGLSAGHFSRAFRRTTGVAPHQWLTLRRIEVAKALLMDLRMSLSQVSLECGFSDQSHFTRTFARITGHSPGAWRSTCQT